MHKDVPHQPAPRTTPQPPSDPPTPMPPANRLLWEAQTPAQAVADLTDAMRRIQARRTQDPQAVIACRIELDIHPAIESPNHL